MLCVCVCGGGGDKCRGCALQAVQRLQEPHAGAPDCDAAPPGLAGWSKLAARETVSPSQSPSHSRPHRSAIRLLCMNFSQSSRTASAQLSSVGWLPCGPRQAGCATRQPQQQRWQPNLLPRQPAAGSQQRAPRHTLGLHSKPNRSAVEWLSVRGSTQGSAAQAALSPAGRRSASAACQAWRCCFCSGVPRPRQQCSVKTQSTTHWMDRNCVAPCTAYSRALWRQSRTASSRCASSVSFRACDQGSNN